MNKEPETYEELIRQRRCIDLTKHYNLSKDDLQKIYEFLEKNPKGTVVGDKEKLTLNPNYYGNWKSAIFTSVTWFSYFYRFKNIMENSLAAQ